MIFQLPQWAGYKDRATFGLADTYLRLGRPGQGEGVVRHGQEQLPEILREPEWAHPRSAARAAYGTPASARQGQDVRELCDRLRTGRGQWWGDHAGADVVCAPGLAGPHCLLVDERLRDGPAAPAIWKRPLKNLVPGGTYLVEVWYREVVPVRQDSPIKRPHALVHFVRPGERFGPTGHAHLLRNNYHQWHKLAFQVKDPPDLDANVRLAFTYVRSVLLVDRLSIRPVSDRQIDSMVNFLQGGESP